MSRFSAQSVLQRAGLTNHDSEDYGSLATARSKTYLKALCSSVRCAGAYSYSNGVVKKVVGKPDLCPDCGRTLFYHWSPYEED